LLYGPVKHLSRIVTDFYYLEKNCELDIIFAGKRPEFKCPAGITDAVIYQNGDVAVCENTKPFANLRDYEFDLDRLWNSNKAGTARKSVEYCFCPHPCYLASAIKNDFRALLAMEKRNWIG
jgi:MoaA/NifB/PqqE/SkfB family radical SAM enzyme